MPLGKKVGLGPGHIVLYVGTRSPTADAPHFRPMPIVAKRSPISATAELLLIFVPTSRTETAEDILTVMMSLCSVSRMLNVFRKLLIFPTLAITESCPSHRK